MLMAENRVAVDFEGTADFVGRATIVKLSDFKGGKIDICWLLACGFKFPPMSVIIDPAFELAGNTALLIEDFRGCRIC